uniref:Penicillin amidase n=1 Tax=Solibacter usitatus (strain Ellin6076) TaxID=234267 RepID=Q01WS0_SOLUE
MSRNLVAHAVKYVNYAIAFALIIAAIAVYWYVWRPLPQRSGSIDAALSAPATVEFGAHGEPHIRAASLDDAFFLQGYVTAQDRLFQMDALRRFAGGTLAEVFGPSLVESDREARKLRMRRIAEDAYGRLPDADRAAFAAYTRGVNQFIATHLNNLPVEFTLLRYQPRPWSTVDCLLLCLHMYRNLTTTWKDEIIKNNMLAQGDRAKVEFLFPMRGLVDGNPGSNAWVLSGKHTASGKPLLSNDMHLEYSLPGIWYMIYLDAPGLRVGGVSLPGAPGVIVGHNERIAWGITNLHFDVQDLYIEKFDDRTGRYLFRGQAEQARAEREIIRVKDRPAVEVDTWITRHGPIFIADGTQRLALRWTAAETGMLQFPFIDVDRAQNWEQFTAAVKRLPGPGSNFVYADVDGNIGYHAVGMLPRRRNYRGDIPVDGSSGNFEWDGFIPFEELPSVYNPPGGMIVTANQNPFPETFPYPLNGNFAPPQRFMQIRAMLSAHEGWRPSDMLTVQKDVYSAFSHFLARQIVDAYQRRNAHNPSLDDSVAMLREWNGQMDKDLPAPFLITLAYQHVRRAVAENASSASGLAYEFNMAPVVVQRLLTERPAGWFADYDDMLLRALADAVEEARRIQGREPKRWRYGQYLFIAINNPVTHQIPLVGKYFDIGPVPMSGSTTTVKQTSRSLAPSMRMTADLGDWDRSILNIPIGQSGQILSRHYSDQWLDYYNARSFPMQFNKVEPASTLQFRPTR